MMHFGWQPWMRPETLNTRVGRVNAGERDKLCRSCEQLKSALEDAIGAAESRKKELKFVRRLLWSFVAGITVISVLIVIFMGSLT